MNRNFRTLMKAREFATADQKWDLESLRLDMYCTDQDLEDLSSSVDSRFEDLEDSISDLESDFAYRVERILDDYDYIDRDTLDDVLDDYDFQSQVDDAILNYDIVYRDSLEDELENCDVISHLAGRLGSVEDEYDDLDASIRGIAFRGEENQENLEALESMVYLMADSMQKLSKRVYRLEILADLQEVIDGLK